MRLLDRFRSRAAPSTTTSRPGIRDWVRSPSPFDVPHTWLQLPALRSAGWLVDVVGESHYQDALEASSGGRTEEGAAVPLVTAQLVREPENPYDSGAVRVDIGGLPCGHIPRGDAPSFHATIDALAEVGRPTTCRAWLTGGWQRGILNKGHFGVRLDVHADLETGERVAVLPFGKARISITGEEKAQDLLAALLGDSDRLETIAVLGDPADRIPVWLRGVMVGTLTRKMSERYRPWVAEVQDSLLPATCEARVVRGAKKVEVFLKLAQPW